MAKPAIVSLLDTDLYKLTMQCAVFKFFSKVEVKYQFTNRTPHMTFTREAYDWLIEQIALLGSLRVTEEEIEWLKQKCTYLPSDYLQHLQTFQLRPDEHITTRFVPSQSSKEPGVGAIEMSVHGLWLDTILYEIPLLALTSEAYFKHVDTKWNHDGQVEKACHKGLTLLEAGCVFSEFGSRRRRDLKTHELVMQGLVEAQAEARRNGKGWTGKFTGTSNVYLAKRYGVDPIGTVAHEWFMAIAAIEGDYKNANEKAMQYWTATYGRGVLAIALTDTFGTLDFLKAFKKPAPKSGTLHDRDWSEDKSFARIFTGVRQDSGDPLEYVTMMATFYQTENITDRKTIVFSDSLNVERCIEYKRATERAGLAPSFGIGTFFTNDFWQSSDARVKSLPLNIVIKLSEAAGRRCVKLSDDKGKNMGDDAVMRRVKEEVGYQEKVWKEGDEAHRWDEPAKG